MASHPDSAAYGRLMPRSRLVRRLLAHNPSPFTFTGTGTFVVGRGTVAVIDPGPDDPAHINALIQALAGETVSHIFVTHTHMDHSPAAPALKAATGALVVGCAPLVLSDDGPRADAGFDPTYTPDMVLADGDSVSAGQGDEGWTLTAVHTPGHTSNHLCFALEQEKALFTGDHVMGWSTTVVAPPDGDMADYMASLQKLIARDDAIYHPTHGEAVTDPQRFVKHLLAHRRQREAQVLRAIDEGLTSIPQMVAAMYAMVEKRLHAAAGRSVLAHLIDLERRGQVARAGERWQRTGEA